MAEVNLFLQSTRKRTRLRRALQKTDGKLAPDTVLLELDAVINESYKMSADITSHPVERGVDISDHIVLKPRTLNMKARISATPFRLSNLIRGGVTSLGGQLGGLFSGTPLGAIPAAAGAVAGGYAGKSVAGTVQSQEENRLENAVRELEAARDSRKPVIIETGLQLYPSKPQDSYFFLQDVTVDRSQGIGRAIDVSLTFQEVIIASSQTVKVEFPKAITAAKKQNAGRKQMQAQTEAKQKSSASILVGGLRGLGLNVGQ